MQDRVSLYPGRVKLEPVAGQANLYDLTRADQPTQEGMPLNKANLLSDATAAAIKALLASQTEDPATPNAALAILAQAVDAAATKANGYPVALLANAELRLRRAFTSITL